MRFSFIFFTIFFIFTFKAIGQIYPDIWYYDTKSGYLLSIKKDSSIAYDAFYFALPKKYNYVSHLKVGYKPEASLFIKDKLIHRFQNHNAFLISIDSLRSIYPNFQNQLFCLFLKIPTYTAPEIIFFTSIHQSDTHLKNSQTHSDKNSKNSTTIVNHTESGFIFWLIGLISLVFIGFLRFIKNNYIPAYYLFNPKKIYLIFSKEHLFDFNTGLVFVFLFFFPFLFSITYCILVENSIISNVWALELWQNKPYMLFGIIWFGAMVILTFKILALFVLSILYRQKIMFYVSIKLFSSLAYLFQVIFLFLILLTNFIELEPLTIMLYRYVFLSFIIIFMLIFSSKVFSNLSIPRFHTLLYLLSIELFPTFLILKYILYY